MKILARVLLNGLGLWLSALLLPGIHWSGGVLYLFVAGFVFGAINVLVRPVVVALSCPLVVLTVGLFYLVINGAMLWLADALLSKLSIDGFGWCVLGGLFLAVYNLLLRLVVNER